ncbi:DUF167 domain-containing protein [Chloroflexota bacterium]
MISAMVEKEQVKITVQVQPNSSRNELLGFRDGVLHVKIAAPPVKGKANQELIAFMGDILGVRKSNLNIEKGITSKRKLIGITGLTQSQVIEYIQGKRET